MGITLTERPELRRQMAAAASKKENVSLSLFLKVRHLEVETEISAIATLSWAEGVWAGRWKKEQRRLGGSELSKLQRGDR